MRFANSPRRRFLCGLLLAGMVLFSLRPEMSTAQASESLKPTEQAVESALLFSFIRAGLIAWPDEFNAQFPDKETVVVGILGESPDIEKALEENKKTLGRRALSLKQFRDPAQISPVHVLIVCEGFRGRKDEIRAVVAGKPILTVANYTSFVEEGGMMAFFVSKQDTVRFLFNLKVAKAAGLKIDPKFLTYPEKVID